LNQNQHILTHINGKHYISSLIYSFDKVPILFCEMKVSIFVWLFRLRELLISFQDVRNSPVEITLWKLGKNNFE
jgi:hypothetical protein